MPPTEYDPETGEETDGHRRGRARGHGHHVVLGAPARGPSTRCRRPFAWVLVRFDGADTSFLHVLSAGDARRGLRTGMRVRPEFAPDGRARRAMSTTSATSWPSEVQRERARAGDHDGGAHPPRLRASRAGVARARTCTGSSRASSSASAARSARRCTCRRAARARPTACPPTETSSCPTPGTVTTYCVVNVPFAGQSIEIPYICAQILLDGANLSFMGLIQEIPTDEIRMGMRVEAVWVEPEELGPTLASVKYFRPNGEPDADYETYKEYL